MMCDMPRKLLGRVIKQMVAFTVIYITIIGIDG